MVQPLAAPPRTTRTSAAKAAYGERLWLNRDRVPPLVRHRIVPHVLSAVATIGFTLSQDVHGPLHPSLLSNADDYQASLQRLIDVDADILCEGHFGIYKGRKDIVRFIRSFMR